MGVFEQFPYTNMHDINLDWIIQKIKTVLEQNGTNQQNIDNIMQQLDQLPNELGQYVEEYLQTHELLPVATTGTLGGIKASDTVQVSATGRASVPLATSSQAGLVKPSASRFTTGSDGTLSPVDQLATTGEAGVVKPGNGLQIVTPGLIELNLPVASETDLGAIKVGANLSIQDGVLSASGELSGNVDWTSIENKPFTELGDSMETDSSSGTTKLGVKVATSERAGVVKPGSGLSSEEDGTLSVDSTIATVAALAEYLKLTGGIVSGRLINLNSPIIRYNYYPGLTIQNTDENRLGVVEAATADGSYANINIHKYNDTSNANRSTISIREDGVYVNGKGVSAGKVFSTTAPIAASASQIGGLKASLSGTTLTLSTT